MLLFSSEMITKTEWGGGAHGMSWQNVFGVSRLDVFCRPIAPDDILVCVKGLKQGANGGNGGSLPTDSSLKTKQLLFFFFGQLLTQCDNETTLRESVSRVGFKSYN